MIASIGEIVSQARDITTSLASSGGAFYGMKQTNVRTAMIVLELRKANENLSLLLDEIKNG